MTKIQKFLKEYEYLKSCIEGAEEPGELGYDWKVNTKRFGIFSVSIHHKEDEKRVKGYSIFGCFEEPNRAKIKYPCNPYSGKYNFHQFDPNECLNFFQEFLENSMGIHIDRNYFEENKI
jgi:hypothetical protein